jgi:hypothetical protein
MITVDAETNPVGSGDFCFTRKAGMQTKPIESAALTAGSIGRRRGSGFHLAIVIGDELE